MRITIILVALLLSPLVNPDAWAQEMPLVYDVENTGADCPEPPLPSINDLPSIEALPDPFAWSDSTRGRIVGRGDWRCRRAEIGTEIQQYELGTKPAPPSTLEVDFADDQLTITVEENGESITLTAPVSIPEGEGPFPAVIGIGFGGTGSLPPDIFTSRDIATVQFNFGDIDGDVFGARTGPFYDLYSSRIGKFAAWAWGISRIIDGLEQTPELDIDLSRLAVTGCSFAGKISLFSGAFDASR